MGLGWIRTLDEVQKFGADGAVRAVRVDALLVVESENVWTITVTENMGIYKEEGAWLWIGGSLQCVQYPRGWGLANIGRTLRIRCVASQSYFASIARSQETYEWVRDIGVRSQVLR